MIQSTIAKDKRQKTAGKQREKVDSGVNNQVKVLELSVTQTPKKLLEFYNSKFAPGITDTTRNVIRSWFEGKISYPSEKQAKVIVSALHKAIDSGFTE